MLDTIDKTRKKPRANKQKSLLNLQQFDAFKCTIYSIDYL